MQSLSTRATMMQQDQLATLALAERAMVGRAQREVADVPRAERSLLVCSIVSCYRNQWPGHLAVEFVNQNTRDIFRMPIESSLTLQNALEAHQHGRFRSLRKHR